MLTRRFFLKSSALAFAALGSDLSCPAFLQRAVAANTTNSEVARSAKRNAPILIVIFQRGAADGLNMVVPFGDRNYARARPSLAIPAPQANNPQAALDLDGFFGLNPAMKAFLPLYQAGQLALVQAVGSPDNTRSHFDAQDYMEIGTPGVKSTADGWLNRQLQTLTTKDASPLRAVAIGNKQPRILSGSGQSVTLPVFGNFDVRGGTSTAFETMYGASEDQLLTSTGTDTFEAIKLLKSIRARGYAASNGAVYPNGQFGNSLKQLAQLIKGNAGLEIGFVESNGWDTHTGQRLRLNQLLTEFSRGIAALVQDLGDRMQDVVILTLSEFGRTVRENGTGGTDHGHATCAVVVGGKVKGGKVYGRWPGLEREQLYENRDLALTTDFRGLCSEILQRHCAIEDLSPVFPNFTPQKINILGLI
jgi:uncharacterized protein (DUF1501 family)